MKGRMPLLLAVAAGVFTVIAMMLYLGAREGELLEQAAPQDIVITNQDILQNTAIDERMIQVVKIPRKYVQPGAIGVASEVVGRVAAVPLPKGSQITGTALTEGGRESLAFDVPRNMRALTLAVDDVTGVGGMLRAGNFIDIIGVFEYGVPTGSQGGQITYSQERTEVITIAQNVQIVAIGRRWDGAPPPPPAEGEAAAAATPSNVELAAAENVTLLMTPVQVQELVLAQQIGALTLSLRSNLDSQAVELPRLDENSFLKVPVPLKVRSQPAWRETRGGQGY